MLLCLVEGMDHRLSLQKAVERAPTAGTNDTLPNEIRKGGGRPSQSRWVKQPAFISVEYAKYRFA